jgi:biotin transport system substrate-specific component
MRNAPLDIHAPAALLRFSALFDVIGVAGLVALGALIRIPLPFTPVPVTLQTLPVLAAAFAAGRDRAFAGISLYVMLGLLGAPLFAAGGATAGYLAGFMAAPLIVSRFRNPLAGMAAALGMIYLMGAGWLAYLLGLSVMEAVALGVAPFLPGALIKLALALALLRWIRR